MTPGTHLKTPRGVYTHHGIYIGNDRVIHYSGLSTDLCTSGPICEVSLEDFHLGKGFSEIHYVNEPRFSQDEIVGRARSRLGENGYCVFNNNCEHFCAWCITGDHQSMQVERGNVTVSAVSGAAASLGAGVVVGSAAAAGVSGGAGIMSGLATVGAVVGGGAVAGVGVLAAGPAIVAAAVTNNFVYVDNPHLETKEGDARMAARRATVAGAVAGTAASVAAVGIAGTAGFSAVGITTGLAAIGGTVGMGMAAGVALTAGLPVVATGLVGFGVYKWFQKKK